MSDACFIAVAPAASCRHPVACSRLSSGILSALILILIPELRNPTELSIKNNHPELIIE